MQEDFEGDEWLAGLDETFTTTDGDSNTPDINWEDGGDAIISSARSNDSVLSPNNPLPWPGDDDTVHAAPWPSIDSVGFAFPKNLGSCKPRRVADICSTKGSI